MGGKENDFANTGEGRPSEAAPLDLSHLPAVYVLASHLSIDEQHEAEQALTDAGVPVTYDIHEARLILANIGQPRRARLELQWKGFSIKDESSSSSDDTPNTSSGSSRGKTGRKRRARRKAPKGGPNKVARVEEPNSDTENEGYIKHSLDEEQSKSDLSISERKWTASEYANVFDECTVTRSPYPEVLEDFVVVVKLDWLNACLARNQVLPLKTYLITCIEKGSDTKMRSPVQSKKHDHQELPTESPTKSAREASSILERAKEDPNPAISRMRRRDRVNYMAGQDTVGKAFSSSTQLQGSKRRKGAEARPAALVRQTTSEHEELTDPTLPPMPDWVVENKVYSCERKTPAESPNEEFIDLLKKIRLARELILDQIGVRAYSTSIASLMAYPRRITSSREILSLPGCDQKIAQLFHEYKENDGRLQAVRDIEADPALTCLHKFYQIWGVGATTAREFYYDKGWRNLRHH